MDEVMEILLMYDCFGYVGSKEDISLPLSAKGCGIPNLLMLRRWYRALVSKPN